MRRTEIVRLEAALFALALAVLAGCAPRAGRSQATVPTSSPVIADEKGRRDELGHDARVMLHARQFDAIESIADSLRTTGATWPSGTSKAVSFAEFGFEDVDVPADPAQWKAQLAELRAWVDAHPESARARIALADCLCGRAWAARGHDYANKVNDSQWGRFFGDLEEADGVLRQCPPEAHEDPLWYDAMLRVQHGLGEDHDQAYRDLLEEALAKFPLHTRFYVDGAVHLMPRWYGSPGAVAAFAHNATRALPDSLADEYYARIVTSQARFSANVFDDDLGLSWPRAHHGLELWHRHWPASTQPLSAMALLACMKADTATARSTFAMLGDTVDTDVWRTPEDFARARAWTEGRPR